MYEPFDTYIVAIHLILRDIMVEAKLVQKHLLIDYRKTHSALINIEEQVMFGIFIFGVFKSGNMKITQLRSQNHFWNVLSLASSNVGRLNTRSRFLVVSCAVCQVSGRKSIGIEISGEYVR
jgi:hypothetical protein